MFRTISSRRVLVLAFRLFEDLLDVRVIVDGVSFGVTGGDRMAPAEETLGAGIWHGAGAGSGDGAGVVVVLRGIKSGVCVELEVVPGLGGSGGEAGRGGLAGLEREAGSGAGGGDGGSGLKGGDRSKDSDRGDNGDKPASSLSISRSSFTKPGGSTPYLAAIRPSSTRHRHTSRGCLCRTRSSDSNR